jgi:diadenosine tetraphosphate (Ap4A) HIT family hydrolase
MIRSNQNPFFVRELETGYAVIGDHQHFRGYTLFLCKEHVAELHCLERAFKLKFLAEMALVAEAVYHAFQPEKLNYELLGNGEAPHLHWHIFPRFAGDIPAEKGPVWWLPAEEMYSDSNRPTSAALADMKERLGRELDKLLQ